MRIAYLCADRGIPVAGSKGASVHVRAVADALAARGHQVTVFAARPEAPVGARFEFRHAGYDRFLKEAARTLGEPPAAAAKEIHALLLNVRAAEVLAEEHTRTPFDAVYERYSLWSLAGLRFARAAGVPHLLEVNAPLVDEATEHRGLELAEPARGIERTLLAGTDAVSVPAEELRSWIASVHGRERRVHVLANAVDKELFTSPPELLAEPRSRLAGKFVVAFAGSLKPWHGVEILLDAFDRLVGSVPQAHLLVVGDGPLRGAVEEAAVRHGEKWVTATGAVDHAEVAAWLAAADVGVAPYPALDRFYFSPLKLVEYQAAGLAVVASQLGQIARRVDHGRTGLLVPAGDVGALVRALVRLARDPALRRRMGRRARRQALGHFNWQRVGERVEEILLSCGARSARPARATVGRLPDLSGAASRTVGGRG